MALQWAALPSTVKDPLSSANGSTDDPSSTWATPSESSHQGSANTNLQSASPNSNSDPDSECPRNWQHRPFNVGMQFLHNVKAKDKLDQEWVGALEINTKSVPRLMKEGLRFTPANAKKRKGRIFLIRPLKPGADQSIRRPVYTGYRWRLVDSSAAGGEPQWIGNLLIAARDVPTLNRFRVEALSPSNILTAQAWDWNGQQIYGFYANEPERNFNAVPYDKPLEGWWPWPKKLEQPRMIDLEETGELEKPKAMVAGQSRNRGNQDGQEGH